MSVKKIAIVGSGVVGKATGKGLIGFGHDVVFADINEVLISKLQSEGLKACNVADHCLEDRDVFIVSVLTPTIDESIDLRFLESSIATVGRVIGKKEEYSLVIIRSTVPPGTIESILIPHLENFSGKKFGKDFGVVMNPEFLREVSAEKDFVNPWIIVIGSNDLKSAEAAEELYATFKEKVPIVHMKIKDAEMMKYVHNLYNANKISFFNEMRQIAELEGVDADKVFDVVVQSAEGSWNKEYGIRNKGPYGGSCLPKDTEAFLSWSLNFLHKKMPLLHSVIRVNENLKDKKYLEE